MLSELLPGVRHLRAPFASGMLWVVTGWLVLSREIDWSAHANLVDSLDGLGRHLAPLGIGFAVTLGAYLIGAAYEALWSPLFRLFPALSSRGRRSIYRVVARRLDALPHQEVMILGACRSFTVASRFDREALLDWVLATPDSSPGERVRLGPAQRRRLTEASPHQRWDPEGVTVDPNADVRASITRDLIGGVEEELDVIGTRLLDGHQDLFNVYDRLTAEAEFRMAIAGPLATFVYIAGADFVHSNVAALGALVVLTIFVVQAIDKRRAAGDRIVDALRTEAVEAPSLADVVPGTYTEVAFKEGKIRLQPLPDMTGAVLYQFVGIPWRRRVVVGLITVGAGLAAAGSLVFGPIRAFGRLVQRIAEFTSFAIRDYVETGGAVIRGRKQILSSSDASGSATRRLADLYRRYGYYHEAENLYGSLGVSGLESLVDTASERYQEGLAMISAKALRELLQDLLDRGDIDQAERVCRRAINKGMNAAYVFLGDLKQAENDVVSASAAYEQAGRSNQPLGFERLGDLRREAGDDDGARAAYRAAADLGRATAKEKLAELEIDGSPSS